MTPQMMLISTNHPHLRFPHRDILRTLRLVSIGERKRLKSLAVICTYSRFIHRINKKFLKHDYATDVIAFPLGQDGGVEAEIYLNLDAARNQAHVYGVTYTHELRRLLIHGLLHLFGYNDKTMREKNKMSFREDKYLSIMNRKTRKQD
jgi:rRNA maturation RNase YbeY